MNQISKTRNSSGKIITEWEFVINQGGKEVKVSFVIRMREYIPSSNCEKSQVPKYTFSAESGKNTTEISSRIKAARGELFAESLPELHLKCKSFITTLDATDWKPVIVIGFIRKSHGENHSSVDFQFSKCEQSGTMFRKHFDSMIEYHAGAMVNDCYLDSNANFVQDAEYSTKSAYEIRKAGRVPFGLKDTELPCGDGVDKSQSNANQSLIVKPFTQELFDQLGVLKDKMDSLGFLLNQLLREDVDKFLAGVNNTKLLT